MDSLALNLAKIEYLSQKCLYLFLGIQTLRCPPECILFFYVCTLLIVTPIVGLYKWSMFFVP